MRAGLLLVMTVGAGGLGACGEPSPAATVDAALTSDAMLDAAVEEGVPLMGFGDLAGMCGVLNDPELTGATPVLVRDSLTFARRYNDPADRPLLTPGGRILAATPNAGGSSGFSELFAFEQLARCERAALVKSETEIVYDTVGKITDILVELDGHKIGVSVVRAVAFPFGSTYTVEAATTIIQRKLEDIQLSSMNVSAADRWVKQVLAVIAYDDQHVEAVAQAWAALATTVRADTVLVVTATHGDDTFLYTNQ
ncbi:MAG: hypothetical protein M3680_03255 [Myxococcota bacterium]|nr:hypothetical protein [Myxococcota bacterium]